MSDFSLTFYNMGTQQTRMEKMDYVRKIIAKSKESGKGFSKTYLISNLMVCFNCTKKIATEIVQAFIDSNHAEEKEEDGELKLYG